MRNPNPWTAASSALSLGAIALLTCTTVSFAAHPMDAFYSDEVYTSRNVGGGYEADDSVYLLVESGLYQKPRAFARFPDGGIVRYLYREALLFRTNRGDSSVCVLVPVLSGGTPGLDAKSSYFETDGDTLLVVLTSRHAGRDEPEWWCAVRWDMRNHAAEPVSESEKSQLLERLTYDGRVRVDDTTPFQAVARCS